MNGYGKFIKKDNTFFEGEFKDDKVVDNNSNYQYKN